MTTVNLSALTDFVTAVVPIIYDLVPLVVAIVVIGIIASFGKGIGGLFKSIAHAIKL
jgi:hypothetical protein